MGFLSSLFGSSKSKPATTTNIVQQKLAPEIAPFATEVLKDAQALYKSQMEKGYDPYTGQTIAPLTPEQEQSMAGIAGLVGTSKPLQEEALETYRRGGDQFTPEVAEQFMSPYQRAVTDIEKRQAQENFEANVMPRFEAQAVGAGGMSGLGSRAGIEAAELQRGQSQLLSDIEARGQQKAFEDARKGFEQQQARERQMAGDISKLAPAMLASGLQEQGALGAVGEQKQQLGQSAMDEAYFKFLEEQQFPQQQLANYSGFVYGNPAAGLVNQTGSGTKTPYQPSFGQTLLGLGSGLASSFLGSPTGANRFADFAFGKGKTGGGIAGLVERQTGDQVGEGDQPRTLMGDIKKYIVPTAEKINRAGLQTIGDVFTGEAFGIPAAIDYITGDFSQSDSEKAVKKYIPSYRTREDARKLELARARETLKNLASKKEPPKSVDTKTPAVPKVEKPKPKTTKKLTVADYKREGLRTEEDILKRAEDIAKQKEELIGDRTRYGVAEGLSDVLGYIAQRALTGESKMDFFTKRQESQKEAEKLLTKTKLQNIDAKAIAEDLGYKAESDLKKTIISRIQKVQTAKLTKTKMLAEIKKIIEETRKLGSGTSGFSFSKLPEKKRVDAAKDMIKNIWSKGRGTKEQKLKLKQSIEKIDDDLLDSLAEQLVITEAKGGNPDQVIKELLMPIIKQQGK